MNTRVAIKVFSEKIPPDLVFTMDETFVLLCNVAAATYEVKNKKRVSTSNPYFNYSV